ncbi:MAG: hypothetical protein ABSF95_13050 [Verrucomicrobiota bacterium]
MVITLILLSVITFMAVTFLVLSQRQRHAVVTDTNQMIAKGAAQAGMQRALAETMATIKAFTNAYNFDQRVSTNYINPAGFLNNPARLALYTSATNVNYRDVSGNLLTGNGFLQNLANLLYSPRPPVYVRVSATSNDFRYYLDLNRNGRYDTNGWWPEWYVDPATGKLDYSKLPNSQQPWLKFWVGDPEWIGVLERPEYRHSRTNLFVSRFAYIILPASKTLDQNYIHNYAKVACGLAALGFPLSMSGNDGFMRNQGVGPWEINLAAFLVDLNTNLWPGPVLNPGPQNYQYRPYKGESVCSPNLGVAFDDALALTRYRYGTNNWSKYQTVPAVFGAAGSRALTNDLIDDFGSGPVMTVNTLGTGDPDIGRVNNYPYPGADSPYHFFTPQDYFDPRKTSQAGVAYTFPSRLLQAGTNASSYNRYTFYRLLSQLGTDSGPEPPTKINLNYVNVDARGNIVPNLATNFLPWVPVQFFTNVAIRLLANAGYTVGVGPTNLLVTNSFGVTNIQIQVWPTNFYTPSVHRLLQVAANIYDATTNQLKTGYPYLPSVFRPVFSRYGLRTDPPIYITGYLEATNASLAGLGGGPTPAMRDLYNSRDRALVGRNDMVYGMPVVIGAKKGLPNFNEFAMETMIQLTRKLEFRRPDAQPTARVNQTNQMLLLCISNVFGLEAWNSYRTNYPRNLQVIAAVDAFASITNELGGAANVLMSNCVVRATPATPPLTVAAGSWPAYRADGPFKQGAFKLPLDPATNCYILTNVLYSQATGRFTNVTGTFERGYGFPAPHWWLNLRTRVRFILVDTEVNRIVDYVNLDSVEPPLDITLTAMTNGLCEAAWIPDGNAGSLWCTNRAVGSVASPTYGVLNQIGICLGNPDPEVNAGHWNDAANGVRGGTADAIDFFRSQLLDTAPAATKTNKFYAPYEPTRTIYYETSWQANDPLVHYTIADLTSPVQQTNRVQLDIRGDQSSIPNLGGLNQRYGPWGPRPGSLGNANDPTQYNLALKDPMVTSSDDWDFPAYKLPNPGWLGRVHRGTPWQTIYLKAPAAALPHWLQWSGNILVVTNFGQIATNLVALYTNRPVAQPNAAAFDALLTHPTNDWHVVDLFTTALDDNIARGQMSVNQANLAAWSALLSGVDVQVTRNADLVIQPAGTYFPTSPPPLVTLVSAINDVRATNFAGGAFQRLGDILRVPELTVNSPFINLRATNLLNDAVYERLPQQVLGLLKGGEQPRFVIYAYGQALKPANNSIVTGGPYLGLCTNYQITAEVATRTVVRIEGATNNPRAVIESFNVLPPD